MTTDDFMVRATGVTARGRGDISKEMNMSSLSDLSKDVHVQKREKMDFDVVYN